ACVESDGRSRNERVVHRDAVLIAIIGMKDRDRPSRPREINGSFAAGSKTSRIDETMTNDVIGSVDCSYAGTPHRYVAQATNSHCKTTFHQPLQQSLKVAVNGLR
ncbi:MAG: hypothetical protein NT113_08350, partial [Hyphomicrobiales bacterium]|nr:hypothetical protein [Hyphomicrobiales bacterium]